MTTSKMRRSRAGWRGVLLVATIALIPVADAHLMPAKQGTLNVVDNSVFAVLAVPVSSLHGFDDNGDGLMEMSELRRHQEAVRTEVDQRFVLFDGATQGETVQVDLVLSPEHEAATDRAAHVVALKHTRFAQPPRDLRVRCDLFGTGSDEGQLTITATRHAATGVESEPAILTPLSEEHRFFRPRLAAFFDDVQIGAEHVLLGPDHLLFLLTVIVAGLGWRYWLSVVTGFTLAHSLTLGAAMLGYLRLPARVVEPAIALSIVLFALDNLLRRGAAPRQRVALVCACGLLHGLGFAGALSTLGLDSAHRILSLVGFNLGVEVGQGLFLIVALTTLAVLRRLLRGVDAFRITQAVSAVALVVGSVWMIQRLMT